MIETPTAVQVPLKTDQDGVIRIGATRVTLDAVIADFQHDNTPEKIIENFDVLSLSDVYAVIAYYLEHRTDVDTYIQHQRDESKRVRDEWEAQHPPTFTPEILQARLKAKSK